MKKKKKKKKKRPSDAILAGHVTALRFAAREPRVVAGKSASRYVAFDTLAHAPDDHVHCLRRLLPRRARAHRALRERARAASSLPVARRRGGLVVRADGGSGINLSGFPYLLARKAGFDTSEGIAGFTPFAELFIGRTAMGGFATGLAQELITGDGILAQIGWRDQPNEGLFSFLLAFLAVSTAAGVGVTFKQMSSGEMSNAQFRRYQNFWASRPGTSARVSRRRARRSRRSWTAPRWRMDRRRRRRRRRVAGRGVRRVPELSPRQEEDVTTAYLRTVELDNARWAMVGFFAAVLMEAKTGGSSRRASCTGRCSASSARIRDSNGATFLESRR